MPLDVDRTPVRGVWFRHVPAGGEPLFRPERPPDGRWQRGAVAEGFYLADTEQTAWAECETLCGEGWAGVLYPAAARPESLALCLFRTSD